MFTHFDWLYVAAAGVGAAIVSLIPRRSSGSAPAQHPLFDALVQVMESKLTELIHVEPGPDGAPIFTLRVVLVQEPPKP